MHSLHTIPDHSSDRLPEPDAGTAYHHARKEEDYDNDADSIRSSRSDQSLEAAGLVSRLSDEEERANRHARYEGGGRRLGSATATGARTFREEEVGDEEYGTAYQEDGSRDSIHGISDGVFRDRSSTERVRPIRRKAGVLNRAWHIAREVSGEAWQGGKRDAVLKESSEWCRRSPRWRFPC